MKLDKGIVCTCLSDLAQEQFTYLFEAGHKEGLHVTALQQYLLGKPLDVSQLLSLQPAPCIPVCRHHALHCGDITHSLPFVACIPL